MLRQRGALAAALRCWSVSAARTQKTPVPLLLRSSFSSSARPQQPSNVDGRTNNADLLTNYVVDQRYRHYEFDGSTPAFRDLWSKIEQSRGAQVEKIVKQWKMEPGNQLSIGLLRDILVKMSSRTWFLEARKLVRWMDRQKTFTLSEADEMLGLDIICRSGCWNQALSKFSRLTSKTEDAYVLLLEAYGASIKLQQAEQLFKELKKSGLLSTSRSYSVLIRLYVRLGKLVKARRTLAHMEASGLSPDAALCWTLLTNRNVFGQVSDKVLAALDSLETDLTNRKDVLRVYGALGKRDQVDGLWRQMQSSVHLPVTIVEYLSAIGAFGALGAVEEAEQVSKELEAKAGGMTYYHCLMLFRMYAQNAYLDQAELLLQRLVKYKVGFEQCQPLVDAYLGLGRLDKALDCFYGFLNRGEDARHPRKLLAASMAKLIKRMGSYGDVAAAETMVAKLPEVKDVAVYNELIYAYTCAKAAGYNLETRMQAAGIVGNDRTRVLLRRHRRVFPLLTTGRRQV